MANPLTALRLWTRGLVVRLLAPDLLEGRDSFGLLGSAGPSFSPAKAMDIARVGSPWLNAAVAARAADLAGLPLKMTRGRGSSAEEIEDHEVLDLLEFPHLSSGITGELFRRQMIIDLDLAGNFFAAVVGDGRPESLMRLEPSRVAIRGSLTTIVEYVYADADGGELRIKPEDMVHVRGPSFNAGAQAHLGSGKAEVLNDEMAAAYHVVNRLAEDAKLGYPAFLVTPKKDRKFTKEQLDLFVANFTQKLRSRQKVIVQGGASDVHQLAHKPSDMDPSGTREHSRQSVIAVTGSVPVRLGLETANYAQSVAMMELYWMGLRADARLIEAGLTKLARMFGDSRVYVRHDFSEVPWLQEDRGDRQGRALSWINDFGLEPSYAASLEGFDDVDFDRVVAADAGAAEAAQVEEEQQEELAAAYQLIAQMGTDPEARAEALASLATLLKVVPATVVEVEEEAA